MISSNFLPPPAAATGHQLERSTATKKKLYHPWVQLRQLFSRGQQLKKEKNIIDGQVEAAVKEGGAMNFEEEIETKGDDGLATNVELEIMVTWRKWNCVTMMAFPAFRTGIGVLIMAI